jgi:hypothetical protein
MLVGLANLVLLVAAAIASSMRNLSIFYSNIQTPSKFHFQKKCATMRYYRLGWL